MTWSAEQGCHFRPEWVILAPNVTSPRLFQISFQYVVGSWDKSRTFSDQIPVHFGLGPAFVQFVANLIHLGAKFDILRVELPFLYTKL